MTDEVARQSMANVRSDGPVIHYVLVDHENVQPIDIGLLDRVDVRVFVFVGAQQGKVSSELAIRMHNLGERAKYVRASAVGANALDFHIAFYVGQLATKDARGFFHVISKDKGYDPLLVHLREQGISGARSESIKAMPLFKSSGVTVASAARAKSSPTPAPSVKPKAAATASGRVHFIVEPACTSNVSPVIPPQKSSVTPEPASASSLAASKTTTQRWTKIRSSLKKMEKNRPTTLNALKKHVEAQFKGEKIDQEATDALIRGLVQFALLTMMANGKLTWHAEKF
jgi:hypothetical protein